MVELQYLLSRLPENSDDPVVSSIREKLLTWQVKAEKETDFDWFTDPQNHDKYLHEFITIPQKISSMTIREFFFSHEKPTYIRLGNILTRRGFRVVEDLLQLTVYQFICIRGVGESGQKTILRSLIVHAFPDNPYKNEE